MSGTAGPGTPSTVKPGSTTPASIVRVRCETCGPRLVELASVRLLGRGDRWQYVFTCTGCGSRVRRSADAALREVLRDAGAVELTVHAPEETVHQGAPDFTTHPIGSKA